MTIIQLRDRLNAIIAENERRGWAERNDLPILVETWERYQTPTGRRKAAHEYFPLESASSGMLTIRNPIGAIESGSYATINAGKTRETK